MSMPASAAISVVRDADLDLAFAGPALRVVLFIVWASVLIAGAHNRVNTTDGLDGLDGLAIGASVMVFGAYSVIGVWQDNQSCALVPGPKWYDVRDAVDLAVVSCAIAGACFGFLWWNDSPAQVIMGDPSACPRTGPRPQHERPVTCVFPQVMGVHVGICTV